MANIFDAIKRNDVAEIQRILTANPTAASQRDKNHLDFQPLHVAAECNADMVVFELLVEHGANVNAVSNYITVVFLAARHCSLEKIKYLHSKGANLSPPLNYHTSYLHEAVRNPDVSVTQYFLDMGLPVDAVDERDQSPLGNAAYNPNVEVVKILVQHGANVKIKDAYGNTPLLYAVHKNPNLEVTKFLLECEIKADGRRPNKNKLLNWSTVNPNIEVMKYLLDKGADPRKADSSGKRLSETVDDAEKKQILFEAERNADKRNPIKEWKKSRRPLPMPKTTPKPLRLHYVELANRNKDFRDYPLPEKAKFYKDCEGNNPRQFNQTSNELNDYNIIYSDLADHDLVTLIDYLDGTNGRSMLVLVLHEMKNMVISGGLDEKFLCWINLEKNADSFANLVNAKAEGEDLICIANSEECGLSDFEPRQLSDRKTILKVAQYYARHGKPHPKYEWDVDS